MNVPSRFQPEMGLKEARKRIMIVCCLGGRMGHSVKASLWCVTLLIYVT